MATRCLEGLMPHSFNLSYANFDIIYLAYLNIFVCKGNKKNKTSDLIWRKYNLQKEKTAH